MSADNVSALLDDLNRLRPMVNELVAMLELLTVDPPTYDGSARNPGFCCYCHELEHDPDCLIVRARALLERVRKR